jgi:hypothetical protein
MPERVPAAPVQVTVHSMFISLVSGLPCGSSDFVCAYGTQAQMLQLPDHVIANGEICHSLRLDLSYSAHNFVIPGLTGYP